MSEMMDAVTEASRIGAAVIAKYHSGGCRVSYKGPANLVTEADLEAEEKIADFIEKRFPGHGILGEEAHKDEVGNGPIWVLDPLDGTHNFAHGVEYFACSVAYAEGNRVLAGAVCDPINDNLYTAERGCGAFANGESAGVSDASKLEESLICTGFSYRRGAEMGRTIRVIKELLLSGVHGVRRFGTASLDICNVGVGRFDGFFEMILNSWDYAAAALFVEEAGGMVSDLNGQELILEDCGVVAGTKAVYEEILAILRKERQGS